MRYVVNTTVNYPDAESNPPSFEADSDGVLLSHLMQLVLTETDATSFVITICKKD